MELRTAASPRDVKHYTTERLREEFLIDDLFQKDVIKLVYSHIDRIITGSAVPVKETLVLTAGDELRADYFLERREMGVINIGGAGIITIDGKEYTGDGFIQHMRDYRKTLDDKVADQFGNIINALEAGENLQYDSDSDVLTGNVDWNVSKLQDKRLDKGEDRTKIGKIFGGLNEGKEQRVRYAINALRGMGTYEEPKEEVDVDVPIKKVSSEPVQEKQEVVVNNGEYKLPKIDLVLRRKLLWQKADLEASAEEIWIILEDTG